MSETLITEAKPPVHISRIRRVGVSLILFMGWVRCVNFAKTRRKKMSEKKFYINRNYIHLLKEKGEYGAYVVCDDKTFANKLWFNRGGESSGKTEFELVCHNVTVIEKETDTYEECFLDKDAVISSLQEQLAKSESDRSKLIKEIGLLRNNEKVLWKAINNSSKGFSDAMEELASDEVINEILKEIGESDERL